MKKKGGEIENLEDMFDKMQIKVVGREGGAEASEEDLDSDDESDGDLDNLANQSFIEDQGIS